MTKKLLLLFTTVALYSCNPFNDVLPEVDTTRDYQCRCTDDRDGKVYVDVVLTNESEYIAYADCQEQIKNIPDSVSRLDVTCDIK